MSTTHGKPAPSRRWLILLPLLLGVGIGLHALRGLGRSAPPPSPDGGGGRPAAPRAAAFGLATEAVPPAVAASVEPLRSSDPVGTLRLEGQVIDDGEQPVAGAMVTVSSLPPRRVKSGDDGSFVFDKLVGGRYTLGARRGASIGGPVAVQVTPTIEPVILRMRAGSAVEVTVVSAAERAPIAGAGVELRGLDVLAGTTGKDGTVLLEGVAPGSYTLAAWAAGAARTFELLTVPEEAATTRVRISLGQGGRVSGRVVTAQREPIADAVVTFERASDPSWGRPDVLREAVRSDAAGRFRIAALAVGTYRFLARHPRHAAGASPPVTVDGHRDVDEVEIVLGPGATLVGQVVDRRGGPVAGAQVRVAPRLAGGADDRVQQAVSDGAGAFRVEGLPRRVVEVVAIAQSASSSVVRVDLGRGGAETRITVTLDVDGEISGVVVTAAGAPVAEAQVVAAPGLDAAGIEDLRTRGVASDVTSAAGTFSLRGLPDGSYQLRASRPGTMRGRADLWSRPGTTARVGDRNVRIVVPGDGSIEGRVLYADGSAPPLFLVGSGLAPATPFSGGDGRFRLRAVPAGRMTLTVSGPSFDPALVPEVAVEADRATQVGTITVQKGRSVSGRVLDQRGSPVPQAAVFAGQRVIGTGSKLTTETWGPPGAAGETREVTTDDQGVFRVSGVGYRDIALVAEHDCLGRSAVVKVPGSTESVNVDLVLAPVGALSGDVTRAGAPVDHAMVSASARSIAINSNFVVTAGADGRFQFDRLATDDYLVAVMTGITPLFGVSMNGKLAHVQEGSPATVHLELPAHPVTLFISVTSGQRPVRMAEVHVASGALAAHLAREVHTYVGALAGGFSSFNIVTDSKPARVTEIAPGAYTLCAVPFPAELAGKEVAVIMQFVEKQGERLPAFCRPIEVTAEPTQRLAIEVALPSAEGSTDGQGERK